MVRDLELRNVGGNYNLRLSFIIKIENSNIVSLANNVFVYFQPCVMLKRLYRSPRFANKISEWVVGISVTLKTMRHYFGVDRPGFLIRAIYCFPDNARGPDFHAYWPPIAVSSVPLCICHSSVKGDISNIAYVEHCYSFFFPLVTNLYDCHYDNAGTHWETSSLLFNLQFHLYVELRVGLFESPLSKEFDSDYRALRCDNHIQISVLMQI